jgi:hypothetical protein
MHNESKCKIQSLAALQINVEGIINALSAFIDLTNTPKPPRTFEGIWTTSNPHFYNFKLQTFNLIFSKLKLNQMTHF